jgi:hypothetical protein
VNDSIKQKHTKERDGDTQKLSSQTPAYTTKQNFINFIKSASTQN